ncbi:unnamed protein product [Closterium sp. NIES-64]|nr:unnamed protein product [Closterium sp. NIES-64]
MDMDLDVDVDVEDLDVDMDVDMDVDVDVDMDVDVDVDMDVDVDVDVDMDVDMALTGMECWPRPRLGNADNLVGCTGVAADRSQWDSCSTGYVELQRTAVVLLSTRLDREDVGAVLVDGRGPSTKG